jgi:DNA polymerase-3 subunit gamma/tau
MTYKVIARKYRPQTFADIVGQQHVTRTLANAIRSNRVAHAYIFSGVRGVGKTTAARILAKALNCEQGSTPEPDNTCDSCREIDAGNSLDVLEIDAASNRGIDQIRELREMVRYAPAAARYKVVILDEAHQLTDEASNALLKTLEEPPERVVFILATTRAEDLVDTIKSRAQLFQFRLLTFSEISGQIEKIAKAENLKIDSGAMAVLARAAEGSLRDGLSLLEQAIAYAGDAISDAQVRELLGVVAESILDELVGAIETQSSERALSLVHRLIADGQNLQHFCRESIRHLRNLLVARVCAADSDLIAAPEDERPRLADQASRFSEEDLTRFFNILLATDEDLRRKPDQRLHLEIGLLKMINAQRLVPLEEAISELRGEHRPTKSAHAGSAGSASSSASTAPVTGTRQPQSVASSPSGAAAAQMAPAQELRETSLAAAPSIQTPPPAASRAASATPVVASSPRIVSRAAENPGSGLAAAHFDAVKSALQNSRLLSSFLEHATRCETEAGEFRIFFSTENRTLTEMLPREAMERLRTVVNQVFGQPLRVCVKLETARGTTTRVSELRARFEEDPIVRAMLEKFGGHISRVKRPGEE